MKITKNLTNYIGTLNCSSFVWLFTIQRFKSPTFVEFPSSITLATSRNFLFLSTPTTSFSHPFNRLFASCSINKQAATQYFPIILFILCYRNNQSVTTLGKWSEACYKRAWNDNDNQRREESGGARKGWKILAFVRFVFRGSQAVFIRTEPDPRRGNGESQMWCINTQRPPPNVFSFFSFRPPTPHPVPPEKATFSSFLLWYSEGIHPHTSPPKMENEWKSFSLHIALALPFLRFCVTIFSPFFRFISFFLRSVKLFLF